MVTQEDLELTEPTTGPKNPADEVQYVLKRAKSEIEDLRRNNHIMGVRLQMFDDCMALLNSRVPSQPYGNSEDVVWLINRHINDKP